jgi:hypothetical protein
LLLKRDVAPAGAPYRRLGVWARPRLPEAAPSRGPALPPKPHAPRAASEPGPARVVRSYAPCRIDARRWRRQSLPRRDVGLFPHSLLCVEVQADAPRTPYKLKAAPPVHTSTPLPPCASPAPLMAAAASSGLRPAAHPTETPLHLPCTCYISPIVPSPLHRAPIAGTAVAAATAAGRRCPPSPALSLPQPSTGIEPLGPAGPFPARARPDLAAGSPDFGRTGAGRRLGTQLRVPKSFQGSICAARVYL